MERRARPPARVSGAALGVPVQREAALRRGGGHGRVAAARVGYARGEVALIGRSNVGKSTLLNSLTNSASLARRTSRVARSSSPSSSAERGATACQLVDMPGYGFALNEETVAAWQALCAHYLQRRGTLKLVLVLVDARTGLSAVATCRCSSSSRAAASSTLSC